MTKGLLDPILEPIEKKITFYHGTDEYGWNETIKQGYLLHKRATEQFPNMSPCTYLATDKEEAKQYGDYVLEVQYNPYKNPSKNNYQEGCWQVRVYEPILLENIKLIMSKGGEEPKDVPVANAHPSPLVSDKLKKNI